MQKVLELVVGMTLRQTGRDGYARGKDAGG